MQRSEALREAVLSFYDRFSANDVAGFDDVVSQEATVIVGTADDEWFTDREKLRSGFGYEGLQLEGGDPQVWEEGGIGWVADRPTMHAPGVGPIRTPVLPASSAWRTEAGGWS